MDNFQSSCKEYGCHKKIQCQIHSHSKYQTTNGHSKMTRNSFPWTSCHFILPVLLQFLLTFAQGQGQGIVEEGALPPMDERVYFQIEEEKPIGTFVGKIPTLEGLQYTFSEEPGVFTLDDKTGEIRTKAVIDREKLTKDTFDLFIQSTPTAIHLIEVQILVRDVNDNSPVFGQKSIEVTFSERDQPGSQAILDTAVDADLGLYGVTTDYRIISGNDHGRFKLVLLKDSSIRLLYLENVVELDREEQDAYQLRISVPDGGTPPRFGYLQVNITIRDFNDHQPTFDHSLYSSQINETSPPGTSVMQVHAVDMDIGPNADITYSIVTDDYDQFAIDAQTGVLTTTKKLRCQASCDSMVLYPNCNPNSCFVTVEARDRGGLSGRAYITVTLMDENDHDPVIRFQYHSHNQNPYVVIDESIDHEEIIALISVTDQDSGLNGQTTVRIIRGNELGHFLFLADADISTLEVVGPIDRERISKYNLTFEAQDKGNPSRSSVASLVIIINDINDHAPIFQKKAYKTDLSELSPVGSFVESITAMDNDTGINAEITYSIISGDRFNWFNIDSKTGLVTTKKNLDRETASTIVLGIQARDRADKPFHVVTNLTINIWDENDDTPTFSIKQHIVKLVEGARPGTDIVTVKAIDYDEGKNGSVIYSFARETTNKYPGLLYLDQVTGRISLARSLDREEYPEVIIKVIASDQGVISLSSTATVTLYAIDLNDNVPVFYPQTYYTTVLENQPAGTSVIKVTATDPDFERNGTIYYSILDGAYSKFSINIVSGLISTRSSLDREERGLYKMNITAKDGGDQTAWAIVEVAVADIQDTPPVFTKNIYSFSIIEDDGRVNPVIGRTVGAVRATTRDESGIVTYDISRGDPERRFKIDSRSGEITTNAAIDREHQAKYQLQVTAIGGQNFGTAKVDITIVDINDNQPRFQSGQVEAYVVENWPVGHSIYVATADDQDANDNGRLYYSLRDGVANVFDINPQTAMITLASSLQYIEERSFDLVVNVRDSGSPSLNSSQSVRITVMDVNDHAPVFEKSSYDVSINEAQPVNDRFFRLLASDDDVGPNGLISFSITRGNEDQKFGIFPDGVLYIAQDLDRETKDLYVLTIKAIDSGVIPRSSSANITIRITDANDNSPRFVNDTFHFYLEEGSKIMTSVGMVSANDPDAGLNAEIIFRIDGEHKGFNIHPKTGLLTNLIMFDREKLIAMSSSADIVISVIASDTGLDNLETKVQVFIHIIDVNDNKPEFQQPMYEATLLENIALYSPVLRLRANDSDSGKNALISYAIISGNDAGKFALDKTSGQLSVAKSLDRELIDEYSLMIMAYDDGVPPLNTTASVVIHVEDVNDNPPVFKHDGQPILIPETARIGDFITKVTATDKDYAQNAFLSYRIAGGNIGNAFRIDVNDGKIFLASNLDYEIKGSYVLIITVHDSGIPQLGSSMSLTFDILDSNDNAPQFPSLPIDSRSLREGVPVNTLVAIVTATDPDTGNNGIVRYSIRMQEPVGNHFKIDPLNGTISTSAIIDREFADRYRLFVVATDQAIPESTRKSSEKIVTITVEDLNDNAPLFVSMNSVAVQSNAQPENRIMTVKAVDPDSGDNGAVVYEIISGQKQLFRIDSVTGELFLRAPLISQVLNYVLTIQARDKGSIDRLGEKSTNSQLTVFIISSSEEAGPQFVQSSYSGNVEENRPAGTSIVTVSASYGSRSTSVAYYVTTVTAWDAKSGRDVEQPRLFQVNPTNGVVSTTQALDRESGYSTYVIEVYAMDTSGSTPQTRKTMVQVTVIDKNDSPPQFAAASYSFSISENVSIGYEIAKMNATDADDKSEITYSIVAGGGNYFDINPLTGSFQVTRKLNRELSSSYEIIVAAADGVQNSTVKVTIIVSDVNDVAPVFSQAVYYFDMDENMPLSSVIGQISASDPDEGVNAEITYSIASHWGREKFALHHHDGIFTLIGDLDFEEDEHYVLSVKAQDAGTPSLSSTVTVYMNVLDVNDNAPVFDPSSYYTEVLENATSGTSVLTVAATDLDSGVNAMLQYSIIGGNTQDRFGIWADTGIIYVDKALDRESMDFYILEVEALDMAADPMMRLSGVALIRISVQDVNDNPPQFISSSTITVMESLPIGTSVHTMTAVDPDIDRNSYVEYYLDQAGQAIFQIDRLLGTLTTKVSLDRETIPQYIIKVTANDQGIPSLSSTMNMTVLVGDTNDHSPVFNPKMYSAVIPENASLGTTILQVLATDKDMDLNADIRYMIQDGDNFFLDSYNGELSIRQNLDYENQKEYKLVIIAQDLGDVPRSDTATVSISVTDVNDCVPYFADSPYVAYVQENTADLPVHVVVVSASDYDTVPSTQLVYFLQSQDEGATIFSMNSSTGIITAIRTLDREVRDEYELIVTAVDSGSPRLTGTGTVHVLVEDDNDNAPKFQYAHYRAQVQENMAAGSEVTRVYATDRDDGKNSDISYSLMSDGEGRFSVDSLTGRVVTTMELDREEVDSYMLVISATDGGSLPRSSSVTMTVSVLDANDNSPIFEKSTYNIKIKDPTPAGSFILGVLATDLDMALNADLAYTLMNTTSFTIDPARGIITAPIPLSSSASPGGYQFRVHVTDKGQNPMVNECTVSVTFLPSNATNFPVFTSSARAFRLQESTTVGYIFTTITAVSPPPSSHVITYYIAAGNARKTFTINTNTGDLSLQKSLDHEIVTDYRLWIEARNNGNPALSSYIMLNITVADENDNAPIFDFLYYNASVTENRVSESVKHVTASDADSGENGRISYTITAGNIDQAFQINASTGVLRTQKTLDRETIDLYQLVILAKDNGVVQKSASATVDVMVLDENDSSPKFSKNYGTGIPITENAPYGQFVLKVTCTDQDIYPNNIITYSMSSSMFEIDSTSGNITVKAALDREAKDSYNLMVSCSDGAYQPVTTVIIDIMDLNDNQPRFVQSSYTFDVVEDKPAGTFIGNVRATDADKAGPNSQIYYRLRDSSEMFRVDAQSGNISSRQPFTYKEVTYRGFSENTYEIHVLAIDHGETPLQTEVKVTVHVQPANKHAPVFNQTQYNAPVAEDAVIGQYITMVNATDMDFGINAELEYYKINGNGSSYVNIDSLTGILNVAGSVSGQAGQKFHINIGARDKGSPVKSSTSMVILEVAKVNLNAPQFTPDTVFHATIPENRAVGSIITTVKATDADTGSNGLVSYFITGGDPTKRFAIDESGGYLRVNSSLDYEKSSIHYLNLTARDRGLLPKQTTKLFTVYLTDVNDNPPEFDESFYTGSVKENAHSGTFVMQMSANDADTADNSIMAYSLSGSSEVLNVFFINDTTGVIRSQGSINYEVKQLYNMTVTAVNPGTALRGTTQVHINIIGVNEYTPVFSTNKYEFVVSESAGPGSSVGIVSATDSDRGSDGRIFYYLIGDSNLRGFSLDPDSGLLSISNYVDRESMSEVLLLVMAKNNRPIHGNDTSEAEIHIVVRDANDAPQFTQSVYEANIAEDIAPQASVLRVSAVDGDILPKDRAFSYVIISGNSDLTFKIDPLSGWIQTVRQLDREAVDLYTMIVGAVDEGTPPKTGTTTVKVQVTDVNDNGPYFQPMLPTGSISENKDPYTEVILTLGNFTFDLDSAPQTPFTYILKNHTDKFDIVSPNGQVKTKIRLDRESKSEYYVGVDVKDAGSPQKTSALSFKVVVNDVNDEPSRSRPLVIQVYAFQGTFPGGKIADVRPLDDDITGNYDCDIISGDLTKFSIPVRCDLVATHISTMTTFNINFRGTDGVSGNVDYPGEVKFTRFDENTTNNGIVMVLNATTIKTFLDQSYDEFLTIMDSVFPEADKVHLFAMQQDDSDVNLFVAVANSGGSYWSKADVTERVRTNEMTIEQAAGVSIQSVNVNPCAGIPCENGGVCSYGVTRSEETSISDGASVVFVSPTITQDIHCACPSGYQGDTCDAPVDHCENNPCANGATCLDNGPGDYRCLCTPYWTGVDCKQDINECQISAPCNNGGTCHNTAGSYSCVCTPQYSGRHCDISLDPCGSNPCHYSGTCSPKSDGTYSCECKYGDRGSNCEVRSRGFESLSYLEYDVTINTQVNFMTVEFATTSMDSLLFYYPGDETDFLALEIIQGRVQLSFKLGNDPTVRITIPKMVSDGSWYRVEAERNGKVGSLKVSDCPEDAFKCDKCLTSSDPPCFNQTAGQSQQFMRTTKNILYVAGVASIDTLLVNPDHTSTHDFSGCLRDVVLGGVDLQAKTPKASYGVSGTCPRTAEGLCTVHGKAVCQNEALCVDEWDSYHCKCKDGFTGQHCDQAVSSFAFGGGALVTYAQKETYKREQELSGPARRKRATEMHVISLTFATKHKQGSLFYSKGPGGYMQLYLTDGKVGYQTWSQGSAKPSTLTVSEDASDSKQHNVTFMMQGETVSVYVDSTVEVITLTAPVYYPLGLDMEALSIAGIPDGLLLPGANTQAFDGCLNDLIIDGEALPMNGATERFNITPSGEIKYDCAISTGPPVHIAVIVICVFFGVVLIVVLVVFFVIRRRRQQKKAEGNTTVHTKTNGSANGGLKNKSTENDGTTGQDSGFGDQGDTEETFIRQHIANSLRNKDRNSAQISRPDLVESDPTAMRLRHGDVVLANGGVFNEGYNEEPPEHYDIDNASSIAPSDLVDIVGHYRNYRTGNLQPRMPSSSYPHHKHPHSNRHHTSSPSSHPDSLTTSQSRHSPMSLSSHQSHSPLTVGRPPYNVNNLNRQSPRVPLHGGSTNIPAEPSSLRSTPLSGISSMYQHNTSYNERPVVNGPSSRPNSRVRQPITQLGLRSTPTMGLTVDDIHRMNTHSKTSPSTMDALSSSSDEPIENKINRTDFTHADLLEPVANIQSDSSSEESANDSFTCSEFEYDNDHMRNDFSNPRRLVPRLTRVDEDETDDTQRKYSSMGMSDSNRDDSFSTFFTSEDEFSSGKGGNNKQMPNALNLEYLLNWGPNFDKLVGVFDDIAQLPDADAPRRANTPSSRPSSRNSPKPTSPYPKPPTPSSPMPIIMEDLYHRQNGYDHHTGTTHIENAASEEYV